jgi:hypothetical protein
MYYDTVADPGRLKTDVWYQNSTDDGVTWSAPFKVTTAMTDETVAGADGGNQYGDYNGLPGWNGTFLPSWTDRRNNASEEIWTANIVESGCSPPPAPPSGAPSLVVDKSSSGTGAATLSWSTLPFASNYDVQEGSLDALASTGSFQSSAQQCAGDKLAATSLTVTGDPAPGSGFWYLVRGDDCGGNGTYDDGSQSGSRDPGIASSGHACP